MAKRKSIHRRVSPKFATYLDNVKNNYSRRLNINLSSADASDIILKKLNSKKKGKQDEIFMRI